MARPSAYARERIWTTYKKQYENGILPMCGSGAPSSSTFTKAPSGQGSRGCQYTDVDTGYVWVNEGTKASPSLGFLGTQVST